MGVLAYEMGPQLEKLRTAPRGLVSAQTEALLVALRPYERTFSSEGETGGGASIDLRCAACKLSCFFQDEEAVSALIVCAKGRKHHRKPWPESLAWLQPVKGVDYEKKWKKQGRGVILDRIAVNQWRKGDLACDTQPVVGGHGPGEGCDFCDAKGAAEADDVALLDEAIAEEELDQALADEEETLVAGSSDEGCLRDEDERRKKEHNHSLKILLRKMGEQEDEDEAQETADRLRKAESWAESYKKMIGKRPQTMTTLAFERYDRHSHLPPLAEDGRSDVKIGDMLLDVPGDQ